MKGENDLSITKLSPQQLDTLISAMEAHHMAMGGMVQATSRPFMFQGRSGPVKKFEEGGPTSEGGTGEGGSYTHADDMRQDSAQDRADTSSYSSSGSGSSGWGGERSSEASRSEPSGGGSSISSSGAGIRSEAGSEGSPSYDNSSASAVAGLTGGAGNGQENVPDYGSSLGNNAPALGSLVGSSDPNNEGGLRPQAEIGSGLPPTPGLAGAELVGGAGPDAYGTDPNSFRLLTLDKNRINNSAKMLQAEVGSIMSQYPGQATNVIGATLGTFLDRAATPGYGTSTGDINKVLASGEGTKSAQFSPAGLQAYGSLARVPEASPATLDAVKDVLANIAVNPDAQQSTLNYANVPLTLASNPLPDTRKWVTAMANDPNSVTYGDKGAQQTYGYAPDAPKEIPYALTFTHDLMPEMMARAGNGNGESLTASNDPSPTYTRPALPSASVQASPNILSSILGVSPAFAGYSAPVSPLASADGMPTSANAYTGLKTPNQSIETSAFMPSAQTADYIHLLSPSNYEGNTPNYSRPLSMAMNDPTVGVQYGSPSSGSMGQGITPQAPAYQGMPWSGGQSQDYHDRNLAGLSGVGNDYHDQNLAGLNNVGSNPVPNYHDMNLTGLSGVGLGASPDYHDRNLAGLNGVGPSPSGDTQSAYNDPRDPSQGYDPLSGRMTPSQYDRYTLASGFGNAPPPSVSASQDQSGGSNYPLARMPMSMDSYGDMPNPGYGLPGMVDPSGLANVMRPPNAFGAPLDKFAFNDGNDRERNGNDDPGGSPAARLRHLNDGGAHIATEGPGFENRGDIPPRSGVDPTNNGQPNPRWADSTLGKIVGGIGNAGLGFFGGPLGSAAVMGDKLISGQTPGSQLINALQNGYDNGTWAPGATTNMASSAFDRHMNEQDSQTGDYRNQYSPTNPNGSSGHGTGGTGTSTLPALIQAALRTRAEDPIDYEHYGMKPMHSYYNYS